MDTHTHTHQPNDVGKKADYSLAASNKTIQFNHNFLFTPSTIDGWLIHSLYFYVLQHLSIRLNKLHSDVNASLKFHLDFFV